MICPDCNYKFPRSLGRNLSFGGDYYKCPKCGCDSLLIFKSKLAQIQIFLLTIFLYVISSFLIAILLEEGLALDWIFSLLFASSLSLPIILLKGHFESELMGTLVKVHHPIPEKKSFVFKSTAVFILGMYFIQLLAFGSIFLICGLVETHDQKEKLETFNQKQKVKLIEYKTEMLEPIKSLSKSPLFQPSNKTKDASTLLYQKNIVSKELDRFFARQRNWWKDEKVFERLKNSPNLPKVDTTWLKELLQYDYWKVENSPVYLKAFEEVKNLTSEKKFELFQDLPSPHLRTLRYTLIINFLQERKKGRGLEALKIIRKMAELSYSANLTLTNMVATSYLKDEHLLVKDSGIKNWSLIPMEKIEAFRKASYTSRQLFYSSYFQDYPEEFLPYIKHETGLCAAGLEMFITLIKKRDNLEPHFLFELDLRNVYRQKLQFYTELLKNCGKTEYLVFLEPTPNEAKPWIVEEKLGWWDEAKKTLNPVLLPYVRKSSEIFVSDYEPDYLKNYNKNQKKK